MSKLEVTMSDESRQEIIADMQAHGLSEDEIKRELQVIQEDIQRQAEEMQMAGMFEDFELFPTVH
jgi:predicted RNA-binding protein with PIN domain